jgi:thiol-disulfide isomerase/thioredoxin
MSTSFADAIIFYLEAKKIKFNTKFVTRRLETHPDYPSLVSATDTLQELGLDYAVAVADKNSLPSLDYPILAHCKTRSKEWFEQVNDFESIGKQGEDFFKKWDGIVLSIPAGAVVTNEIHTDVANAEKKASKSLFISIFIGLAAILAILRNSPILLSFITLSAIAGIVICVSIINYLKGKDNPVSRSFCKTDNITCDKVLKSSQAKIGGVIGVADLGLLYFSMLSLFCLYVTVSGSLASAFPILEGCAWIGCVASIVSFVFQGMILKNWCRICLALSVILWLQLGGVMLYAGSKQLSLLPDASIITTNAFFYFVISALAVTLSWIALSPYARRIDVIDRYKTDLGKLKRNPDVFLALLFQQPRVNIARWEEDIVIGNPNATVQLIICSAPYCPPCGQAHESFHRFMKQYPNETCLTMRFAIMNASDPADKRNIAVANIFNEWFNDLQKKDLHPGAPNAVDDWYSETDLEKFRPGRSKEVSDWTFLLQKHEDWFNKSRIVYTPTIYINGYRLPATYTAYELIQLLPALSEKFTQFEVVANTSV